MDSLSLAAQGLLRPFATVPDQQIRYLFAISEWQPSELTPISRIRAGFIGDDRVA